MIIIEGLVPKGKVKEVRRAIAAGDKTILRRSKPEPKRLFSSGEKEKATKDLWTAVLKGNLKGAKEALSRGADINDKDEVNQTPLMWAAHENHPNIVDFLLLNGADVHAKDDSGSDALAIAQSKDNKEISINLIFWINK